MSRIVRFRKFVDEFWQICQIRYYVEGLCIYNLMKNYMCATSKACLVHWCSGRPAGRGRGAGRILFCGKEMRNERRRGRRSIQVGPKVISPRSSAIFEREPYPVEPRCEPLCNFASRGSFTSAAQVDRGRKEGGEGHRIA